MSKILVISPTPTHPRGAGNRSRIETMLKEIISAGHELTFLHIEQSAGDREAMRAAWGDAYQHCSYRLPPRTPADRVRAVWSRLTKPRGVFNYRIDAWYDPDADRTIKALHEQHRFDAVIVEYVFMSRALCLFGNDVRKIIDTHDMFTDRHQRYLREGQKPQWFSTTAAEEGKALDRADCVLAISEAEREAFTALTNTPVLTVGHFIEPQAERSANEPEHQNLLFMGSDNPINHHGIAWFIEAVLPQVREQHPRAEVRVVGSVCRLLKEQPGVRLLGRVDELDEAYAQADIVINPVKISTGLSIKNLEALSYGCPLVASSGSARGLGEAMADALIAADEADAWRDAICNLLADGNAAKALSDRARAATQAWNDQALRALNQALQTPA